MDLNSISEKFARDECVVITSDKVKDQEIGILQRKSSDNWDQLLDFKFDDVPKFGEELPTFVCKMGKSNHNKKRAMENFNFFLSRYWNIFINWRHVIETMAYNDKYKKILDEVWKDKVELDGKTIKEDEEAEKRLREIH
ncbi:hypothetical protein Tco_1037572 [Tanacetum coccineum]